MGAIVAEFIKYGLPAATAWALAHLGVDPEHVKTNITSQGAAAADCLHKILDVVFSKIAGK